MSAEYIDTLGRSINNSYPHPPPQSIPNKSLYELVKELCSLKVPHNSSGPMLLSPCYHSRILTEVIVSYCACYLSTCMSQYISPQGDGFCRQVMHRYMDCHIHYKPIGFYKCSTFIVTSFKGYECVGDCQSKMELNISCDF